MGVKMRLEYTYVHIHMYIGCASWSRVCSCIGQFWYAYLIHLLLSEFPNEFISCCFACYVLKVFALVTCISLSSAMFSGSLVSLVWCIFGIAAGRNRFPTLTARVNMLNTCGRRQRVIFPVWVIGRRVTRILRNATEGPQFWRISWHDWSNGRGS